MILANWVFHTSCVAQITEEAIKQHGADLGMVLSNAIKGRLASELNSTTVST